MLPPPRKIFLLRRWWLSVRSTQESQVKYIRNEFFQARGLIPVLMKHRRGEPWSPEERATLLRDLRALSHLSPYLIPLLFPGGVLMLPLIAWWMERRHKTRKNKSNR
jgi:hypothetical protein